MSLLSSLLFLLLQSLINISTARPSLPSLPTLITFMPYDSEDVPFRGFIFDPPSRGYLCKFHNNYDCTLFPAAADITTHFNKPFVNSHTLIYPWRRVNLKHYLLDYNSTHAQLNLHWHDSGAVPHVDEYVLLETKNHDNVVILHRLLTLSDKTEQDYLDHNTRIVSVPHLVAYKALHSRGSLTALWFALSPEPLQNATSILQVIDYHYNDEDEDDDKENFDCEKTFDRTLCAEQGWTTAACEEAYFYECDIQGAPTALKQCPPFQTIDSRQPHQPCTPIVLAPNRTWHFANNDRYYGYDV